MAWMVWHAHQGRNIGHDSSCDRQTQKWLWSPKSPPPSVFRPQIPNLLKQLHLLGAEYSKHKLVGTFQLQPLTCAFDTLLGVLVLAP